MKQQRYNSAGESILAGMDQNPIGGTYRRATYTDPVTGARGDVLACDQRGQRSDYDFSCTCTCTKLAKAIRRANGQHADVSACAVRFEEVQR